MGRGGTSPWRVDLVNIRKPDFWGFTNALCVRQDEMFSHADYTYSLAELAQSMRWLRDLAPEEFPDAFIAAHLVADFDEVMRPYHRAWKGQRPRL